MSRLSKLIEELCPTGVEYKKLGDIAQRLKGTPITATLMKQISSEDGEIRIFAGGKTMINAHLEDIPNANITYRPALLVQSRGVIDFVYYDKPFTFKNEMWAYTMDNTTSMRYLYYYLKDKVNYFRDKAVSMGAFPQISLPVTDNFEIPVPPLPVQEEIVRILDKFTTLEAELEAELDCRKRQYEFYRDKLFSTSSTIKKIGELTKVFSCPRVFKNQWQDSGVPFWRSSDVMSYHNGVKNPRGEVYISHSLYDELSRKSQKIEAGDILVTGGGSIGVPYLKKDNTPLFVKDADLICIKKCDSIIPSFLYHYFFSTSFRQYLEKITHDATIAHYTIGQIIETPIPVPPLSEQRRIVSILDRFEALTTDLQSGLPAEIEARRKQYEYYRERLLTFKRKTA